MNTIMKTIIIIQRLMSLWLISILLFFTSYPQNIWYVDGDVVGGNSDGTSWTNAWKYIGTTGQITSDEIDWAVIGNGDTIYISGGAESITYLPQPSSYEHSLDAAVEKTFTSTVVVCPSWETGRNGEVILEQPYEATSRGLVMGSNINNVKLTGITYKDTRESALGGPLIYLIGDNNTIENCNIFTAGVVETFQLEGYKLTVRGCNIIDPPTETIDGSDFFMVYGRGDYIIDGNLMIANNNFTMIDGDLSGVSVTDNSLTDTDLSGDDAMTTDYFVGIKLHRNGAMFVITSNNTNTFYGTGGWLTSDGSAPTETPPAGNWYMEGAHRDVIQVPNLNLTEAGDYLDFVVSNNMFVDRATRGTGWNGLLYSSSPIANLRYIIYNNIFVNREEITSAGIFLYDSNADELYSTNAWIFNNTIIMKGAADTNALGEYLESIPLELFDMDTLVVKNNLVVVDTMHKSFYNLETDNNININNNIYGTEGYNLESFGYHMGTVRTFAQWQALGYDLTNSDTMQATNVTFTNKYDTLASGYRTTTGVGLGENLSLNSDYDGIIAKYPDILNDINGAPRGSSWDIGAVQYFGNPPGGSNDINVKSKVFLQGPYNTNSMNTNLSQNSLLPNSQPFNTSPWNYNGNESLSSGSSSSYVDWVLVELRSSSNSTQVVSRRAAILKNDGALLNCDGSDGVLFSNVQEGAYYVAVFHRNHLAVMSAAPVQLTANSQLYDFTNGMNKAFGTNPMADLGGGKFGMYGSDGNSNGGINIIDRNEVWAPQNGNMGYLKGDFNLDGGVTASDVNLYWNINNGTMTQVP